MTDHDDLAFAYAVYCARLREVAQPPLPFDDWLALRDADDAGVTLGELIDWVEGELEARA